MARRDVTPGNPPLLWDTVRQAFNDINTNFTELYATVGGGSPVDLSSLDDSIIPGTTGEYVLGQYNKRWKEVHVSEYIAETGETNGLWIGLAQLKGIGATVDLPSNSTVGGQLIIDTDKTFFKEVQVDNDQVIVASDFVDSLNLISGTAMRLTVDSSAESITIDNIGVTQLAASSGISVSASTGNITVTNTGILSVSNGSVLPAGLAAGSGIKASATTGAITLTNTGVLDIDQGYGITVSRDDATGVVTITNSAPAQVAFRTLYVTGTNLITDGIVADNTADQLNFTAGYGMLLTPSAVSDTLTFAIDQHIDIYGSVFAQDSSVMVDTIDQKIFANYGEVDTLVSTAIQSTGGMTISSGSGEIILQPYSTIVDVIGGINTTQVIESDGGFVGDLTGDVTGSLFGDDSAALVDGVNGLIVGEVDTPYVTTENGIGFGQTGYQMIVDESGTLYVKGTNGDSDIVIRTNASGGGQYDWTFGLNGNTTFPGSIIATHITADVNGSVFANDSTIIIDGNDSTFYGKAVVSTVVNSTDEQTGGSDSGSATALDLTKSVQRLDSADTNDDTFSLADGEEGQIMYFVAAGTQTAPVYIIINNARTWNGSSFTTGTFAWIPFDYDGGTNYRSLATAIYTDGAWNIDGYVAG